MRVYLDMCCYNRPYDDQSQIKVSLETQAKLHIQDLIQKKRLDLVSSYMLRYECGQNPYDTHAAAYVGLERRKEIEAIAKRIMDTGVKFKDACHVASAVYANCEYFISTDKRLLKYKTEQIKLVSPIDFVTEMEDE